MRNLRSMSRRTRVAGDPPAPPILRKVTKRHKCPICNNKYSCRAHLSRHVKLKHLERVVNNGYDGKVHSEQSNGFYETRLPLYKCSHCVAVFKEEIYRDRHLRRIHSGRNVYHCSCCKSSFNNLGSLNWHKHIHNSTNKNVNTDKVKSTRATLAGKRVMKGNGAKKTMNLEPAGAKTKNGVQYVYANRFTCSYCPKLFSAAFSKKSHERFHTGVRPFSCKLCEVSFECQSKYEKHVRECKYLHSMVFCKFCDFHTFERLNLESHYKRMHGFTFESDVELEFFRREILLDPNLESVSNERFGETFQDRSPEHHSGPSNESSKHEADSSSIPISSIESEEAIQEIRDRILEPSDECERIEVSVNDDRSDKDAIIISLVDDELEERFQGDVSNQKDEPFESTTVSEKNNRELIVKLEDDVPNQCLKVCPKTNLESERDVDSESIVQRNDTQSENPADVKVVKDKIEVAQLDDKKLEEIFHSDQVTESSTFGGNEVDKSSRPCPVIDLTGDESEDELDGTSGPIFLIDDD